MLTAIVYTSLVAGKSKIATLDINMNSYQHDISANGGFDSMSLSLSNSRLALDEWIEQGVGRHIEIYNSSNTLVWEGFVNMVSGNVGAHQIDVGPLIETGNRVMVAYAPVDYTFSPPVVGDRTVTTVADNDESQERYGIIEKVISGGRVTDAEAENIRDTFLAENAYPSTSSTLSFGGSSSEPTVTLNCLGYWYWTNAYVYNDATSGSTQVDTRLAQIINGNPNTDMYGTPVIGTNNAIIPSETEEDKMAMAMIKGLLSLGGASDQRYTLGFYEDRVAYYNEIPSDIAYKTTLSDQGQRIQTFEGALVYPWDIRPAQWIFISDALVGRYTGTNIYEDPRYMFIERVTCSDQRTVTIVGSRIGTFEQIMARFGLGDY